MFHMLDVLSHALEQAMTPPFTLEEPLAFRHIIAAAIAIPIHRALIPAFAHIAAPDQPEPVFADSALRILYMNHVRAVAALPHEFLMSSPGFRIKPDIRTRRDRT